LQTPAEDTVKGARDRAILASLLYHGMRRVELCGLAVKDINDLHGPLFRPVRNNRTRELERPFNPNSIYRNVVRKFGQATAQPNLLLVHRTLEGRPHL